MFNRKSIAVLISGLFISACAQSLSNENFKVTQVDVTKTLGIVWFDVAGKTVDNQPECNSQRYGAISCEIDDSFCNSMISIALVAKTTGTVVDFDYDGLCKGSFATGSRFRLSN